MSGRRRWGWSDISGRWGRRSVLMRRHRVLWSARVSSHAHRRWDLRHLVTRVAWAGTHRHQLLSPYVAHVPLLFLVFIVCKLHNKWPSRAVHHDIVVQAFDSLHGRLALDISQESCTLAGSVRVANHVDFLNLAIGSKNFSDFSLSRFSG